MRGPPQEAPAPGIAWALVPIGAALLLAPALGMPNQLVLQDTLKSIIVSFGALLGAAVLFVQLRRRPAALGWHPVIWLPLLLAAYALGSMGWSHAYLGGVEAVRWFVFAVLLAVGMNTLTPARLPWLAAAVHAGAVLATLWAALQFWLDWRFFAQGPPPASTFVNRNFFAEYAVCALPFGSWLALSARRPVPAAALGASVGFVATGILMTGTRSALVALGLLLLVLPLAAWRFRREGLAMPGLAAAAIAALSTVLVLGSLPGGNAKLLEEGGRATPIERALRRTASIQLADESLQYRRHMWRATTQMIAEQPLSGVGAGAWEVYIPLYQGEAAQLETDYYAHNEALQLLAETGVAGAVFLAGLVGYLLWAAWRTWRVREGPCEADAPGRVTALASLLALLVVSNAGFPWRMAATGALFATALAVLAASDLRAAGRQRVWGVRFAWCARPWASAGLAASAAALVLAAAITRLAIESESKLVKASELALAISKAGDWDHPRWIAARAQVVRLLREGITINPHYRKITPLVGDEFARWGDWANATWVWESVLASRPFVVALLTNAGRGHVAQANPAVASEYLARARRIAPQAPSVVSLHVILLARYGDAREALVVARQAMVAGNYDLDLLTHAFLLGWRANDDSVAEQAIALRLRAFPQTRVEAYLELAEYRLQARRDPGGAVAAWRDAVAAAPAGKREAVLHRVPPEYRAQVGPR